MTREEAISILKSILADLQRGAKDTDNVSCCLEYGFITYGKAKDCIKVLEQEPQTFKWCTDCKEYDQEKHCCHRWSKAIRDTVEEMKEEYIEREVLDELRAEITTLQNRCYALTKGTMCAFCKYECKYKAESEDKKNNNE